MDLERRNEFLRELGALSNKYRIGIGGCGCCSSPFLYNTERDGEYEVDPNAMDENGCLFYFGAGGSQDYGRRKYSEQTEDDD